MRIRKRNDVLYPRQRLGRLREIAVLPRPQGEFVLRRPPHTDRRAQVRPPRRDSRQTNNFLEEFRFVSVDGFANCETGAKLSRRENGAERSPEVLRLAQVGLRRFEPRVSDALHDAEVSSPRAAIQVIPVARTRFDLS